jgi:hypothetical protein
MVNDLQSAGKKPIAKTPDAKGTYRAVSPSQELQRALEDADRICKGATQEPIKEKAPKKALVSEEPDLDTVLQDEGA